MVGGGVPLIKPESSILIGVEREVPCLGHHVKEQRQGARKSEVSLLSRLADEAI